MKMKLSLVAASLAIAAQANAFEITPMLSLGYNFLTLETAKVGEDNSTKRDGFATHLPSISGGIFFSGAVSDIVSIGAGLEGKYAGVLGTTAYKVDDKGASLDREDKNKLAEASRYWSIAPAIKIDFHSDYGLLSLTGTPYTYQSLGIKQSSGDKEFTDQELSNKSMTLGLGVAYTYAFSNDMMTGMSYRYQGLTGAKVKSGEKEVEQGGSNHSIALNVGYRF